MQPRIYAFGLFTAFVGLCLIFGWHEPSPAGVEHAANVGASESEEPSLGQPPSIPTSTSAVRIPIFIYHSVRPDYDGETQTVKDYAVTPELLDQELSYLTTHGYSVISMDELAADIHAGSIPPGTKPVVLTFDDGWQNQYVYALPLLKKYHLTATFYIFSNAIGKRDTFMTWDEIRALSAAGMTIGDHTQTHPLLSKLTPEQLSKEVLGAKKTLETEVGKPVVHFASPFGYTSDVLVALLKTNGFVTGRTTYKGATHSGDDILKLTGYLSHRSLKDFVYILEQAK